jgi:hypothetical protein
MVTFYPFVAYFIENIITARCDSHYFSPGIELAHEVGAHVLSPLFGRLRITCPQGNNVMRGRNHYLIGGGVLNWVKFTASRSSSSVTC